jgi:hypothetical protein
MFSSGLVKAETTGAETTPAAPSDESFASAVAQEQLDTTSKPAAIAETSGGSSGAIVPFTEIQVEKAAGDNSYTVEEIFTKAKELKGKTVRLRGKVVKFNANIMGKNWVHLQDGTGNPMDNTHDLVVTTEESAANDSIIVVEGNLATEKDFGAGYTYAAIVEEAKIIQ